MQFTTKHIIIAVVITILVLFYLKKNGASKTSEGESANNRNAFVRIENNEAKPVLHTTPSPHYDKLTTWYKINIPAEYIPTLTKISKHIEYDPKTKLLKVLCQNLASNTVTTWIVKKYVEDELNLDQALGMYGPMITELNKDDPNSIKLQELTQELLN